MRACIARLMESALAGEKLRARPETLRWLESCAPEVAPYITRDTTRKGGGGFLPLMVLEGLRVVRDNKLAGISVVNKSSFPRIDVPRGRSANHPCVVRINGESRTVSGSVATALEQIAQGATELTMRRECSDRMASECPEVYTLLERNHDRKTVSKREVWTVERQ